MNRALSARFSSSSVSGIGATPSRAAAEARIAPRRQLEWQVVVLRGIVDAETKGRDVEKRHPRQREAGTRIEGADVQQHFVSAGIETPTERGGVDVARCGDGGVRDAYARH